MTQECIMLSNPTPSEPRLSPAATTKFFTICDQDTATLSCFKKKPKEKHLFRRSVSNTKPTNE